MTGDRWMSRLTAGWLCAFLLVLPGTLAGQEDSGATDTNDDQAAEASAGSIGVGLQSSFPAYGASLMLNVTEAVSLQGVVGPIGNLNTYAARGLLRFDREEYRDFYAYGMVGGWTYSLLGNSETVPGAGAGVGIEGDIQGLDPDEDLPPIYLNAEFGLGIVNFDQVAYNFSSLMFGVGIHYRF